MKKTIALGFVLIDRSTEVNILQRNALKPQRFRRVEAQNKAMCVF